MAKGVLWHPRIAELGPGPDSGAAGRGVSPTARSQARLCHISHAAQRGAASRPAVSHISCPLGSLQLLTNGKEGVPGALQAFSVVSGVQVARSEGSGP